MADIVTLDELNDGLNLGGDTSHDDELDRYIDAASAHVTQRWGEIPSQERVEVAVTVALPGGTVALRTHHRPVLEVASITGTDGTVHTTGITVTPDGYITHDAVGYGRWTVTYTSGYATVPADLKLAVLEDIRGLYQPGQIGPPAAFGAFGIESLDTGPSYRPVRMWPRVDAWIDARRLPGFA